MTREKAIAQLKEDYNIDYTENSKELEILKLDKDYYAFNNGMKILFSPQVDVKNILSVLNSYLNVEKYVDKIIKNLNTDTVEVHTISNVVCDGREIERVKKELSKVCRGFFLGRINYSNKYNVWFITEGGMLYSWCDLLY